MHDLRSLLFNTLPVSLEGSLVVETRGPSGAPAMRTGTKRCCWSALWGRGCIPRVGVHASVRVSSPGRAPRAWGLHPYHPGPSWCQRPGCGGISQGGLEWSACCSRLSCSLTVHRDQQLRALEGMFVSFAGRRGGRQGVRSAPGPASTPAPHPYPPPPRSPQRGARAHSITSSETISPEPPSPEGGRGNHPPLVSWPPVKVGAPQGQAQPLLPPFQRTGLHPCLGPCPPVSGPDSDPDTPPPAPTMPTRPRGP